MSVTGALYEAVKTPFVHSRPPKLMERRPGLGDCIQVVPYEELGIASPSQPRLSQ